MPAGLRTAVGFLTRIPMGETEGVLARAVGWFPIVGALIGAAQGVVLVAAAGVVDPLLAAALSVAASTLVTGAFHLDGIADVADAFGGGWTREQRLAILKDSRLGTYGTATVVLVLLIETAALASIADGHRAAVVVATVVCAHSLSRTAAVVTMLVAPTASADGLGAAYVAQVGAPALVAALAVGGLTLGGLVVLAADETSAVLLMPAAMIVAVAVAAAIMITLARHKIGGISGDVLGAVQQLCALATLVAVAGSI